jgi:hypothetical protein
MNTKHKNYKKYLAVQRRQGEIREAQRNLGYEKLDKPYQKGWDAYWVLRKDISRRDDAEYIQSIIDYYGTTIYSRDGEFRTWSRKEKKYVDHTPSIKTLSEKEYNNLKPWAKKWFEHDPSKDTYYWWFTEPRRYYKCTIPKYFLKMKKVKHWVTHYKVMDEVLEQEYAELDALEERLVDYRSWWTFGKSAKPYKKYRSKEFRLKEKRAIKKAMRTEDWDDMDLPKPRKCILWDMY